MTETGTGQLLQKLVDEHDQLSKQIADLQQFWHEVNELGEGPKYEEMGSRVQNLRTALADHIAEEEQGGYLAPDFEREPKFAAKAESLRQQHQKFLATLDDLIKNLKTCDSAYRCWQEVRTDFDDFLNRLREHEAAETAIVDAALKADH